MTGDALFLAIDVGTTGARASAVDLDGRVVPRGASSLSHRRRRSLGWAEQDPRRLA